MYVHITFKSTGFGRKRPSASCFPIDLKKPGETLSDLQVLKTALQAHYPEWVVKVALKRFSSNLPEGEVIHKDNLFDFLREFEEIQLS